MFSPRVQLPGGQANLSGYVTYTGAMADLNLGAHKISAANLNISNWDDAYSWGDHASAGYAKLDGSNFPFTTDTLSFGDGSGAQKVQFQGAFNATLAWNPTAVRLITLPDATGTVALTSDLSAYLPLAGGTMTGALRINYNGATPLSIYDTTGATELMHLDTAGMLYLPTTGGTGGIKIGGDVQIYRDAANSLRTPDTIRSDNGFSVGAVVTSTIANYFAKTYSTSVLSPTSLRVDTTVTTNGNTGFASGQILNATLNSTSSSAGIGGLFGFATLTAGDLTGTAYGLFYTARDSRTGTNASTTIGGASLTAQINATCNSIYANAVYSGIFTLLDLSTGGAVPTSPHAAASVSTITFGNLSVSNAWRYYWALAGSGTTSAPLYGFEIGRISNSTSTNVAIQLDGTNEIANRIRWGTTNWVAINRSANNTATIESASGTATLIVTGVIRANLNFNVNGTDGISATPNYYDALTFTGGILTAVTPGSAPTPSFTSAAYSSDDSVGAELISYVDTSGGDVTLTLPSSPSSDELHSFINVSTGIATVDGNGNNITDNSVYSEIFVEKGTPVWMQYSSDLSSWIIIS